MTGPGTAPIDPFPADWMPRVIRAAHVEADRGRRYEDLLRDHVTKHGAPDWIALITNGLQDLQADLLERPGAGTPLDAGAAQRARNRNSHLARLLSIHVSALDRQFEVVRTGRLIRVVLQTPAADAYCLSVVPGQYVVGVLPARVPWPREVAGPANTAMIELATACRAEVRLPTQDPGGLMGREAREKQARAEPETPRPAPGPLVTTGSAVVQRVLTPLRAALTTLDPDTVHQLTVSEAGAQVRLIDQFDDIGMQRHFLVMTAEARRAFYAGFVGMVNDVVGRLGRAAQRVMGGPVRCVVLDVESGAVVVQTLEPGKHLIGVTLDQDHVSDLEDLMAVLARET